MTKERLKIMREFVVLIWKIIVIFTVYGAVGALFTSIFSFLFGMDWKLEASRSVILGLVPIGIFIWLLADYFFELATYMKDVDKDAKFSWYGFIEYANSLIDQMGYKYINRILNR